MIKKMSHLEKNTSSVRSFSYYDWGTRKLTDTAISNRKNRKCNTLHKKMRWHIPKDALCHSCLREYGSIHVYYNYLKTILYKKFCPSCFCLPNLPLQTNIKKGALRFSFDDTVSWLNYLLESGVPIPSVRRVGMKRIQDISRSSCFPPSPSTRCFSKPGASSSRQIM